MHFYVGLHQPSDARRFIAARCCISVRRLRDRKTDLAVGEWLRDSGAFTELRDYGRYRQPVSSYAAAIRRWSRCGHLVAAVAQDYMCEPAILQQTGLTVADHQRLTIARYDELRGHVPHTTYILPVLQGSQPHEYAQHVRAYGRRLPTGAWVGVGSLCSRSRNPAKIVRCCRPSRPRGPICACTASV